ncbi:hypothetical protein ONE63_007339 [Megalurothrips usitatus]|uniref:Uncharacterized protein n=1 Tax=Megalurothrips usitatus TaxID=439358 RepID=A0AAV7XSH9_9NEOP|nr:hypothetical protein ONE63_007339 [Megalurothrips usitatus]
MCRVLLCVALPALAAALTPLAPPGPRRPPQADCALALLRPHLQHGGTQHLLILALDGWVDDAFVGQLAAHVAFSVVSDLQRVPTVNEHINDIVFVAARISLRPERHLPRYFVRTVIWYTVGSGLTYPQWIAPPLTRLVVTSSATGETRVFYDQVTFERAALKASRRWSASEAASGSCGRGPVLFPPPCLSWRPPADGAAGMVAYVIVPPVLQSWTRAVRLVLDILHRRHQFVIKSGVAASPVMIDAFHVFSECRVYLLSTWFPVTSCNLKNHRTSVEFPWESSYLMVVVPAGMGRGRSPLHRLTDPFTLPMWMATAAVAMATALVLWLLKLRVGAAVLQALAPLLAQPPPAAVSGQPRFVMGAWLLVAVVVAAAYQGRLLSELTVPDPAAQINSLEELNASGLPVYTRFDIYPPGDTQGDASGALVPKLLPSHDLDLEATARSIAEHRNAAAIWDSQHVPAVPVDIASKLHVFRLPGVRVLRTLLETTEGSPMELPIRRVLGRLRAAGVLPFSAARPWKTRPQCGEADVSALSLQHLIPPFVVLGVGLVAAVVLFMAEKLNDRRRTNPVQGVSRSRCYGDSVAPRL